MKRPREIHPLEKQAEIMERLRGRDVIQYTSRDEGFEYLPENGICIGVLNPSGEQDLYIDLEEDFIVSCGEWDAHYAASRNDYQKMLEDIEQFLNGELYLAVVYVRKDWICSLSIAQKKIDRRFLLQRVKDFLHSAGGDLFIKEIREKGAEIRCMFWNEKRSQKITVKPGGGDPDF